MPLTCPWRLAHRCYLFRMGILLIALGVALVGCTSSGTSASCTYSEQHDKSNDLNTGNDAPPLGAEDTGLVLGASSMICGAVNQGDYTTHDDNTADGDSYQFTVTTHVSGTLTLSITGDVPPAPEFRVFILTPSPDDHALTGYATLDAAVPFDLQPGTYVADMQAKLATGPLSQDYPYEIAFAISP